MHKLGVGGLLMIALLLAGAAVAQQRTSYPDKAVRVGDRWSADNMAIQELTDLEKIDKADFDDVIKMLDEIAK
jgi:hypothetical protein